VLSNSGRSFSAERSDVLKKVKKGCSFRASLSVCLLIQCFVCVLIFFQGEVVGGELEEDKVLEKELKEKKT